MARFKVGDVVKRVRCHERLAHTLAEQPIGGVFTIQTLNGPGLGAGERYGVDSLYYAFDSDYELVKPKTFTNK